MFHMTKSKPKRYIILYPFQFFVPGALAEKIFKSVGVSVSAFTNACIRVCARAQLQPQLLSSSCQ